MTDLIVELLPILTHEGVCEGEVLLMERGVTMAFLKEPPAPVPSDV